MTYTNPSQWPGFSDQPVCLRDRFTGKDHPDRISTLFGCGDWACVCNHYPDAVSTLTSYVSHCESQVYTITGTNVEPDLYAAVSIFNQFCSQLSGPTTKPPSLTPLHSSTSSPSMSVSFSISTTTQMITSSIAPTSTIICFTHLVIMLMNYSQFVYGNDHNDIGSINQFEWNYWAVGGRQGCYRSGCPFGCAYSSISGLEESV